ncbi:MAG: hypothetical protein QXV83_01770 [Candidatus Anstonellaceae archaeon]
MNKKNLISFFLVFWFLLFFVGCVKVEEKDRLNQTNFFDFTKRLYNPEYKNPCTIFLCTKKNPDILTSFTQFFKKFLGLRVVENDIAYSNCDFYFSNAAYYKEILENFNQEKGWWPKCEINSTTVPCAPRFFMVGQGSNPGDFSLAQRYCDGQLNMPVFWIIPNKEKKLDPPSLSWLSCENSKSRIPVLVLRTVDVAPDGSLIDSAEFVNFLQSLKDKNNQYDNYYGPIFITTEALAKPYYFDQQTNRKILNITLLNKIANQIELIKKHCSSCITVLALEPTFNENGLPDLCPIDYFYDPKFDFSKVLNSVNFDPLNCSQYYPSASLSEYLSRPAKTKNLDIDVVGVGVFANSFNYSILSNYCSPSYVISAHLQYSSDVIKYFELPTLWYAIAISEGPTIAADCEFTKEDVALAFEGLINSIEAFRNKGVIGIAPYIFLNNYANLPIPCTSQKTVLIASKLDLQKLKNGEKIDSISKEKNILINRIFYNSQSKVFFEGQDGNYYLIYNEGEYSIVNKTGCQFGFKNLDNTPHNNASLFFWFSNCQYYFLNRGTLFYTPSDPTSVREGDKIFSSTSNNSAVFVEKIIKREDKSVLFADSAGAFYLLTKDGSLNKLYLTTSNFLQYTVSPLIFPRNGLFNSGCLIFSSGAGEKLYAKNSFLASDLSHASTVVLEEPRDPQLQKNISLMQCGLCFFSSPMPKEFCSLGTSVSFPKNACVQYPQMDVAFIMNEADPIFMRAIAVGESGLGRAAEKGASSPACQIGKGTSFYSCNAQQKSLEALKSKANNYCSEADIERNYPSDPSYYACGLGVMQCIDFPSSYAHCGGSAYNPFNPYDSACCGSTKFMAYFSAAKKHIQSLRNSNEFIKQQITDEKEEWYAALLAAYSYFQGEHFSKKLKNQKDTLEQYLLKYSKEHVDKNIDFAYYFVQYYVDAGSIAPYYGINVIKRYNEGLKTCNPGCLFTDCDYLRQPI